MYYQREVFDRLYDLSQKNQAVVLIGTRQVGKTVLMKTLSKKIQDEGKVTLFFDLELPSSLKIFSNGLEGFLQFLKSKGIEVDKNLDNRIFIFIDEFQYIEKAGSFVKAVIDNFPKIQIVASGSSSIEIQKSLNESLVGRKKIIHIHPLTFGEFLVFLEKDEVNLLRKNFSLENAILEPVNSVLSNLFFEFIIWGGMPRVAVEKNKDEKKSQLDEIVSSYLQKDIKALINTENVLRFNELMQILASETATTVNVHSLSKTLKMNSRELERYLYVLEHTFVNYSVPPLYTNKRKELSKMGKSFFYDTGIRNFLVNNMSEERIRADIGKIMETAIYNEINKNLKIGQEIHYWRTIHQTEVDLVLEQDNKFIPIEIKSGEVTHIPKAVMSFIESYKCNAAVIFNQSTWSRKEYKGIPVYIIPSYCAFFAPHLF